jgi:tetratricopeptide (TPR) repeat protein
VLLGLLLTFSAAAQTPAPSTSHALSHPVAQPLAPEKLPSTSDRRKAAKIFLQAGKLFMARKYEQAMGLYQQSTKLDPTNKNYSLAIQVARSHAVTALIEESTLDRQRNDEPAACIALERAMKLDPSNVNISLHLNELGDDQLRVLPPPLHTDERTQPIEAALITPTHTVQSFHEHNSLRQIAQQVFHAYGIEATIDDSVHNERIRFDLDDATFEQAVQALQLVTHTFFVPLDPHRVLLARDSRELRLQYMRQEMETIYLNGLQAAELTELATMAKTVFQLPVAAADPGASTLTVRGIPSDLDSFNRTLQQLIAGRSQVLLDVRIIQIAHTNEKNHGVELPQSMSAFNVYAEEESILKSNSTTVNEIVSSGLASANDPLAIIAILVAAGDVSSSLFSSGFALFGGGLTESAFSPGTVTVKLNVNSSDSRQLDRVLLRAGDNDASTFKLGTRYPIQTSSYSSLTSSSSVAGLTTSGTSSALSSLLSSASSSTTPMVEYQDLGLTLKTTANVNRSDHVALTLDVKIDALSGETLDGNPVLNSRSYSGVITVKPETAVVIAGELDKSQTRAVSGTPGLDDIPGLSQLESKDVNTNYATLMLVITPHIVRGPQAGGHSAMIRIERGGGAETAK